MKKWITINLFLLLIPFISSTAGETDTLKLKKNTTWYAGIHFAGNAGLFSGNFGKTFFNDHLDVRLGYGYLPQSVNDVEVHTLLLKTSYYFSRDLIFRKAKWYLGVNTLYGFASNTFVKLPSHYPDDYYSQNAVHFAPYLGIRAPFIIYKPPWADNSFVHLELGTLDMYTWYMIKNKEINFWDICNLSFGLSLGF